MKTSLRQAATPQRRARPRVYDRSKRSSSGQHPRRRFLGLAAGFAALPISRIARAQSYPARPVRIIVGFLPGDSTDVAARLISQRLSERLRQQFFVENRAGAAGNIATEAVVRVVNPLFPAATVPAFIAYAKSNPGKVNMASAGSGTMNHVVGELFNMIAGIKMLHVAYRGGSPAIADLLGGQVQVFFVSLVAGIEYVKAKKLRALAITSAARSPVLPDVPAMGEFLEGCEASIWLGLSAPKNTPAAIVEQLNTEINAALADPEFAARLAALGGSALRVSPTGYAKLDADETEKWAKVIQAANIQRL